MVFDDALPDLVKPNVNTIGFEHEWALAIYDFVLMYFEYDLLNNCNRNIELDKVAVQGVAIETLRCLPAWKMFWHDDADSFDEVCRQLQLQLCILGRVLLFIAKQIPHGSHEHALLANLHLTLYSLPPHEYMPERFFMSNRLRQWTAYWLEHPLTNQRGPDPNNPPHSALLFADPTNPLSDHLPSRNIWLFDHYLTPREHANLVALSARIYRVTHTSLLQLEAQTAIEKALCHHHTSTAIDAILPGAATWFLYAYDNFQPDPSNPSQMLKGWYDIWVPRGDRLVPTGPRFAAMHSDEMRWWVFFKERFVEIRSRTDVGLVAREYAEAAARKMDFLDGSGDKPGFWEGLRQRVSGKKRETRL